jgi:hypothetical protein
VVETLFGWVATAAALATALATVSVAAVVTDAT